MKSYKSVLMALTFASVLSLSALTANAAPTTTTQMKKSDTTLVAKAPVKKHTVKRVSKAKHTTMMKQAKKA